MTKQWNPLADPQWNPIPSFFNVKRKHDLRHIMNRSGEPAIFWVLRTGCQWRNLPHEWPHWQAVFYYFDNWKTDNTLEQINCHLNKEVRKQAGREAESSVLCIDSQSVKLHPLAGEYRGLDANKRVSAGPPGGRNRQFVVDTEGRLWLAGVHRGDEADGGGATTLVTEIALFSERLEKVYGDQAYNGVFVQALAKWSITFEKASRSESTRGFVPVAKRWVMEPVRRCGSIAWTNFFRRIVKNYEYTLLPLRRPGSVAWLYVANIQLMLQRIKPDLQT